VNPGGPASVVAELVCGTTTAVLVRRANDSVWLDAWEAEGRPKELGRALVTDYPLAALHLSRCRVLAGELPKGAVRAEVRDRADWTEGAVAQGRWLLIAAVDTRDPLNALAPPVFRFVDDCGVIVARPWPAVYTRPQPVSPDDVSRIMRGHVRCPVCEAGDWLGASMPRDNGNRLACAACGYSNDILTTVLDTRPRAAT
jgi:hypothetical protein